MAVDEFFVDPARLLYRRFDRQTNPVVEELLETHARLFTHWSEADFEELHSRVGTGGPLTVEGALAAVEHMNQSELMERFAAILESDGRDFFADLVNSYYQRKILPPKEQ